MSVHFYASLKLDMLPTVVPHMYIYMYSLLQKYRRSTWVESLRAPGWGIGEGPYKAGGAVAADPPL